MAWKPSPVLSTRAFVLTFALAGCTEPKPSSQPLKPEPAPATAADVTPLPLAPPKRVFARKYVARVRRQPTIDAPQLGYLRAGALLTAKTAEPVGHDRCRRGWYEIEETGGFVCDGREITAFEGESLPDRQPTKASRSLALPYQYGYSRGTGTPMYKRLPTETEALYWEDGVVVGDGGAQVSLIEAAADAGALEKPVENSERTTLAQLQGERGGLVRRKLKAGFFFSLDREFETARRRYWRTLSNGYIPHARVQAVTASAFHGVAVSAEQTAEPASAPRALRLPIAFVAAKEPVRSYAFNARDLAMPRGELPHHAVFEIGEQRTNRGKTYFAWRDGLFVRADQVTRVDAVERPPQIESDARWIDVDLSRQTLVAYQGSSPVYATLVSTGRLRNERKPKLNSETPSGLFRILSKHVTTTMDGDHSIFGAYSLEDVPWVQFFQGAFALHGAFWHDKFGRTASHGCVNLAPEDARWLFTWTTPDVPAAWHGAYPKDRSTGTWLHIHGKTPKG